MTSNPEGAQPRETWIEFHDSQVASIERDQDGAYVVAFAHLNVFERIGKDVYEVWGYEANLRITGANDVALPGPISKDDHLVDGSVTLPDGTDISENTESFGLGVRCSNCKVELRFSSGGILRIAGVDMTVAAVERLEFQERWVGPLRSA